MTTAMHLSGFFAFLRCSILYRSAKAFGGKVVKPDAFRAWSYLGAKRANDARAFVPRLV